MTMGCVHRHALFYRIKEEVKMIELGKVQNLIIERLAPQGAYLTDGIDERKSVLLPLKEVAENAKLKDEISVFIYRDSSDRLIATTRTPKIKLGELAALKVVDITKIGAFLDWGLEKDLLLPHSEQIAKIEKGKTYLTYLYIDKSDRLCATMKVYPLLKTTISCKVGDWVEGYVYQINPELGAFVAIENKYHGLIPAQILNEDVVYGEQIKARVAEIRSDGKIALSPTKKAYKEIPRDAEKILEKLINNHGELAYNDKSSPNAIMKEFNMSKASFKRAVGFLLKSKKIRLTERGMKKNGK